MNPAVELYQQAMRLGLRLEPRGDKLAVIPASRCSPEFAEVLRRHKGDLLELLEPKGIYLLPDSVPWLHVARQVLAGEFEHADHSLINSLRIGLRGINHPLCRSAIAHLRQNAHND